MNLVYISEYNPCESIGGAEISSYTTANNLAKFIPIIYFTKPVDNILNHEHKIRFVTNSILNFSPYYNLSNRFMNIKKKELFKKCINNFKLDPENTIIHAQDMRTSLLASYALKNTDYKIVCTVRDYWPICISRDYLFSKGKMCEGCSLKNIYKCYSNKEFTFPEKLFISLTSIDNLIFRNKCIENLDAVAFVSKYISNIVSNKIKINNQATIYNPIPSSYIKNQVNNSKNNNILYIGRLEKYKGIEILLKAFKIVNSTNKEYRLNIVGGGNLELYKNIARNMGISKKVIFHGKQEFDKINYFYDNSDIVVLPHLFPEPFGRTSAEAMARGKVVITGSSGGPSEFIEHGINGFLVNTHSTNSPSEIANLALDLINDDAKRIKVGKMARKYAITNFHPDKISKDYLKFYETIID